MKHLLCPQLSPLASIISQAERIVTEVPASPTSQGQLTSELQSWLDETLRHAERLANEKDALQVWLKC